MSSEEVAAIRARLDTAALFLDFDGTLSEIVPRPEDARPLAGVRELLPRLSAACKLLAIVSGRSAEQLVAWLGTEVEIWGVHGAEVARGGKVDLAPEAAAFSAKMATVKSELEGRLRELDLPGVLLEDKGVILNVHYRRAADPEAAERALASMVESVAARSDLIIGRGRMTLELRPRATFSKEEVVRTRARVEGVGAALFIGDDVVDLPAFDALDELAKQGVLTLKVAVNSYEAPSALLARSDLVVEGPSGVVAFLEGLL